MKILILSNQLIKVELPRPSDEELETSLIRNSLDKTKFSIFQVTSSLSSSLSVLKLPFGTKESYKPFLCHPMRRQSSELSGYAASASQKGSEVEGCSLRVPLQSPTEAEKNHLSNLRKHIVPFSPRNLANYAEFAKTDVTLAAITSQERFGNVFADFKATTFEASILECSHTQLSSVGRSTWRLVM